MEQQLFEVICRKISDSDYKLTPQRKVILNVLFYEKANHLSAEEIYGMVKKEHPEIGLATVYRTLDMLAELEIVRKMNFGDGCSRYEFTQDNEHHHHHLICVKCGEVLEFEDDLLESVEKAVSQSCDFEVTDHIVKFYGYCSKCRGSK